MKNIIKMSVFLFVVGIQSCSVLNGDERVYVNHPEMQMGSHTNSEFVEYIQSIREGSTGVKTKKGSGGCGCN